MKEQEQFSIWIRKIKEGDRSAFRHLYETTVHDVYRTVVFLTTHQQDIEDIMNEIYIKVWASIGNYDTDRPFRPWLHGLVIRQVQDWRRKMWRKFRIIEKQTRLELTPEGPNTEHAIVFQETSRELLQAVHSLSYKLRIVILLRYFHDYSLNQIAEVLDLPVGTVKSRHHSALKQLRRHSIWLETESEENVYVQKQS